jgi:hypothetical protein
MRFKIVSVGWECADFLTRTLRSIDTQTVVNYDVMIIDDASADPLQAQLIESWCGERDERWQYRINPSHRGTCFNQWSAIWWLDPRPDDVVVWLDLDGDQFAHRSVLDNLMTAYSDGRTLLTYGSYRPVPDHGTCPPVLPFPDEVVRANSYRAFIASGGCNFNHLRTMSGRVARAITPEMLSWRDTEEWYEHGADYGYMINGLELAGGRHKMLDEVLCLYNNANPKADWLSHPVETNHCVADLLRHKPCEPL